ncbi:MAG: glutathione S-transferase [Amaricoccus sp.]|uniref:glutathione S-transferase n=1 Tax=Amaricoccus sp. TaxID=1872485 RepID=UPI0039E6ED3D
MRLFHSATSPFVRKVMVVLHETGQLDRVELVPAAGSPVAPGTMPVAVNPLGKVPTLERPDGPALYDSRVITRYLDALGEGGLYPESPRLWETLTLEATGEGITEAALLMVYEARLREAQAQNGDWIEGQWSKAARALDVLEARWLAHLAGRIDAGQIAVGCALGYLDFRHGARDWRAGRPGLARWFERFGARPAMVATRPVE